MKQASLHQARWVAKNREKWNTYQRERYRRLHPEAKHRLEDSRALTQEQRFALIDKRVSNMSQNDLEDLL